MQANRLSRYFGLVGAIVLLVAACAPAAPASPTAAPAKPAAKEAAKPAAPAGKEAAKPAAPAGKEAAKPVAQSKVTPVTLKAISSWEKTISYSRPLSMLIERLEQKTNGAMKITFTGPEVVPPFEALTSVSNGVFDLADTTPAFYATQVPEGNALQFALGTCKKYRDAGAIEVLNQVHRQKTNTFILGCAGGGHGFVFLTKDKVESLDYFRGKKIRTTGLYTPILNALGAAPVEVPPADVYTALERGVVDGIAWPESGIIERKVHEVLKYMVKPAWLEVREDFIMSVNSWNKLSPDQQKLLQETVWEMEPEFDAFFRDIAMKEQEELKKQGLQIVELPKAEADKLQKLVYDSVWGKIVADSPEWGPKLKEAFDKAAQS